MQGHLVWNSVSVTTGKKYNSTKSNWKNYLQPITNKYCDELGLAIMPAEYAGILRISEGKRKCQ